MSCSYGCTKNGTNTYACFCQSGFTLAADGHSCEGIVNGLTLNTVLLLYGCIRAVVICYVFFFMLKVLPLLSLLLSMSCCCFVFYIIDIVVVFVCLLFFSSKCGINEIACYISKRCKVGLHHDPLN